MGRDSSVVSTHKASLNPVIRSIVDADNIANLEGDEVSFSIKPHKLFIFSKEDEKRIYFEVK